MSPKEKANYIVFKYFENNDLLYDTLSFIQSKECALVAVDEIIDVLSSDINPLVTYWFEVKQEIEKL